MAEGRCTVREIVWQDICPWLILLRVFRIALRPRVLILAAVALVLVALGWNAIDFVFKGYQDPLLQNWIEAQNTWPWQTNSALAKAGFARGVVPGDLQRERPLISAVDSSPVIEVWERLSSPFRHLFNPQISIGGLAYSLTCCLWVLLVWGFFGAAITRIAALALAREEQVEFSTALGFARAKLGSYVFATLLPLVAILAGMLAMALPSLLMRFDFGLVLAGIFWPLVLLIGLLFAIVLLGLWFGWPLMWPAISTEGTDAFDALSRSYAYVYQRPLHYFFYVIVAAVLGFLGVIVVNLFAGAVLYLSDLAVSWGAGFERMAQLQAWVHDPSKASGMAWAGAGMIAFWRNFVVTLALAFQFAFFWVAIEGIYLLLRRREDATEMDEVFVEEEQPYGLPQLESDAIGVPGVAVSPEPTADEPLASPPRETSDD